MDTDSLRLQRAGQVHLREATRGGRAAKALNLGPPWAWGGGPSGSRAGPYILVGAARNYIKH
eukprot:5648221-Pyramimonas_sp.AAC.1